MSGSEYASFSPNGENLVFVGMSDIKEKKKSGLDMSYATMSVNVVKLKTGKIQTIVSTPNTLLDAGYVYSNPSFSPDGKLIAFQHSGSDVSGGFSIVDQKGKTIFRFPQKASDTTPYWRPQFTPDGKEILCFSPATSEKDKDQIFLIDIKKGTKKLITEGSNPTFACKGKAVIYEKWVNKWSPEGDASSDLWFLELRDGAEPKVIVENASRPNGFNYCPLK